MSEASTAPPGGANPLYDCLVVSDLHLGSEVCQAKLLEEFLEWAVTRSRVLVFNGDVFDDLNFNRLTRRHFACLKIIRRNSDRDDFRLIWIRGNHDGPADVLGHVVGVEILDEFIYENRQIRLLILHGDQFDKFVHNYGFLTELACWIFYYIQLWAPHQVARYVRRVSKEWQRSSQQIQSGAIEYAKSKGCRFVTCGHTHLPLVAEVDGITYLNSGTWTDHPPCPFVAVRGADVRLEYWPLVPRAEESLATEPSTTAHGEPRDAAQPKSELPLASTGGHVS
jgi:UDP-2,3-diacylglucosamine pyrophosphatase LpxH